MAYNFKSIADVDVVEELSEEAHVLIEEDGVIKRAPKTAVGGGEYVLDIEVIGSYDVDIDDIIAEYTIHKIDTFANIKNKLLSGEPQKFKANIICQSWHPNSPYVTDVVEGYAAYSPYNPIEGEPEHIIFSLGGLYCGFYAPLTSDDVFQGVFVD